MDGGHYGVTPAAWCKLFERQRELRNVLDLAPDYHSQVDGSPNDSADT